ncbi:MAG: PIG-L family deacetylase [Promethearchaeia archaeon]
MKIIILEPHPDDLLFGPGPLLLDWINEDYEIHVITVTDGRACYRLAKDVLNEEAQNMTEDEVADMRINEAKQAIDFLGLPSENHHLLKFHDAEGQKYVDDAVQKVKPLLEDVDRLVLPSDSNGHEDHQATHDIGVKAAKELELKDIEYFVYFIATYGQFKSDSEEQQFSYSIDEEKRKNLFKWLKIYQSQKKIKFTWKMYNSFLKNVDSVTYGKYTYEDIGKYYNF